MYKILLIEDDKNLNKGLELAFQDKYKVISATSLEEGYDKIHECDLLLLDMNLPDGDGLDLISKVRKNYDFPIVVLSARDMEMDIVAAIQMGADDYITKPFSLGILQAKIERILERLNIINKNNYKFGKLYFNFDIREFKLADEVIHLTLTEEKILYYLIEAKGNVVSREQLLEKIWDVDENFIDENTLSVNVNRLRKKLEPEEYIETIYGVGYRWNY